LQSPKPVSHVATRHAPLEHRAVARGTAHTRPHSPQLLTSSESETQRPSQRAPPSAHEDASAPASRRPESLAARSMDTSTTASEADRSALASVGGSLIRPTHEATSESSDASVGARGERAMSERIIVAQGRDRWCVEERSRAAMAVIECAHCERAYRRPLSHRVGLVPRSGRSQHRFESRFDQRAARERAAGPTDGAAAEASATERTERTQRAERTGAVRVRRGAGGA